MLNNEIEKNYKVIKNKIENNIQLSNHDFHILFLISLLNEGQLNECSEETNS